MEQCSLSCEKRSRYYLLWHEQVLELRDSILAGLEIRAI